MLSASGPYQVLLRKLDRLNALSSVEVAAIQSLTLRSKDVRPSSLIVKEGETITECCLLVQGFACRNKLAANGGRQIVSFHMAGDILDIQHLMFSRADHNVQAITECQLIFFPVQALRSICVAHPAVATALWRDCLVDASIFREWVLNVGRRDAKTRIAHMLCEFVTRCEAAGLGSPERFRLPMTQEQIGDATGLTPVHVNRMLRELTEQGIIRRANGSREIQIVDWERMKRVADFDPAYLHLAA